MGLWNQKVIQVLLDCLELDPSSFVRVQVSTIEILCNCDCINYSNDYTIQVARCLGQMKRLNLDVMKRLEEKSRGIGIVAQYVACCTCSCKPHYCYEVSANLLFFRECQVAHKCLLKVSEVQWRQVTFEIVSMNLFLSP